MAGTNITLSSLINVTTGQITNDLIGSDFIAGIILLALIGFWFFKSNGNTSSFIVIMFPLVLILTLIGFLPEWMMVLAILGIGLIFVKGFLKSVVGA